MNTTDHPTERSTRRRKLSVSIAEELAAYAAERAARDERSVSDVVNEGLELVRGRERDALAAVAYADDADETLAWAEAALPLADEAGR